MEEKEYGFFDYFNSFQQWLEEDSPTDKAARLYMRLFCMMNRRGWQGRLGVDTQMLMSMSNTKSKVTAYRARDELVRAGLIEYKPGKKGKASLYHFLCTGKGTKNDTKTKYCIEKGTGKGIEKGTKNDTETEKEREKRKKEAKKEIKREKEISLKTKTQDKDAHPPKSPQGDEASERDSDETKKMFETFCERYPKTSDKATVWNTWQKLNPDAALFEKILRAVERQANSDQWREENGRFIPNPAKWLNEKRWEWGKIKPTNGQTPQMKTEISKEAAEWLKDEL